MSRNPICFFHNQNQYSITFILSHFLVPDNTHLIPAAENKIKTPEIQRIDINDRFTKSKVSEIIYFNNPLHALKKYLNLINS